MVTGDEKIEYMRLERIAGKHHHHLRAPPPLPAFLPPKEKHRIQRFFREVRLRCVPPNRRDRGTRGGKL